MTNKEMTELFAVMLLAWPNAETFKGGIAKLAPTIRLWTSCTADVDFWTGQQAVIRLCKKCKFPPTIAEFQEQVGSVNDDIKNLIGRTYRGIRSAKALYGSIADFYAKLQPGSFTKMVIDTVGGIEALYRTWTDNSGSVCSVWNLQKIEDACRSVIRGQPELVGGQCIEITAQSRR